MTLRRAATLLLSALVLCLLLAPGTRALAPIVRVTSDSGSDSSPAITRTADGKLRAVWLSSRSNTAVAALRYSTSTDAGSHWSTPVDIVTVTRPGGDPAVMQAANGRLWVAYVSLFDIFYITSDDGGATWSPATQLTETESEAEQHPAIVQAANGTIFVAWDCFGNDIWYRKSSDGGATWSEAAPFTSDDEYEYEHEDMSPAFAREADGTLWLVWAAYRDSEPDSRLWYRKSTDNGVTWSDEAPLPVDAPDADRLSMAVASNGVLWLAWSDLDWSSTCPESVFPGSYSDVWYSTSDDGGDTWLDRQHFTIYAGPDSAPSLAALPAGQVGVAWGSERSGNMDIWFGIPGQHYETTLAPYVACIAHEPYPTPLSTDTITFRADARDEKSLTYVKVEWTLNGVAQTGLRMYDDGTHGDDEADDGVFATQLAPLAADSQVTYRVRATDGDGNSVLSAQEGSFTVLAAFAKTADILLVIDRYEYDDYTTARIHYFTDALDAAGYAYDVWDTPVRGDVDWDLLSQYTGGAVIYATPHYGPGDDAALADYLDAGGKLFITGQDVADLRSDMYLDFLNGYLYADFVQDDSGSRELAGVPGDPIGDGLAFGISGGDGADDQSDPDEIGVIAPAVPVFRYNSTPPSVAALRVDTGTYKLVYFAFGFEGINTESARNTVMARVLAWLGMSPPPRVQLSAGWNLVSLPVEPGNTDLEAVLAHIEGKYDAVYGLETTGGWLRYITGRTDNNLTDMYWGQGYWIHATQPATLVISGALPDPAEVSLVPGWNLVGYPGDSEQSVADALASIAGKYDLVYAYDPTTPHDPWKRYNVAVPAALNDLTQMAPGRGYWIHVTEDCVWSVP